MKTIAFVRSMGVYNCSRSIKEILALAHEGYNIVILGWDRDGKAMQQCENVFKPVSEKVEFRFFNACILGGIGFKKIDILFRWILWVKDELSRIGNMDFVHACDLDAGLGAYWYCKSNRKKLVYDIFDYYVDSHPVPGILKNFVEGLEIKIINYASATVICTEERMEQISKSTPQRVYVIHNSPDISEVKNKINDFDYAYCGSLSNGRLISEFLKEYPQNNDLKVQVSGPGKYAKLAESIAQKEENFDYNGIITYPEALDVESRAKVLSAIYEPTKRNHRLCAPNKFYEALALGKPLIVCKGTGIDKVVEKYEIGIVINYSVEEFYEALRFLINNEELCKDMGTKARVLYEEKYNWIIMEKILLKLYSEI